ncbi:DUF1566 domain-containing protein [Legionella sp. km772]|uniref:DUF1566 domain-containing protein n=1 Tax=Legionella sp. km772 TaxID=2498111 RepID=UPI000F8D5EDA|nr:DUF1566 domain-containing protein [Legionella sp. km772]RUR12708.1 hypothetical protein ELY15_04255 [Legionella sp. km772]
MLKKLIALLSALLLSLFADAFAHPGALFKIKSTGTSLGQAISINLCLNVKGQRPLSCQRYVIRTTQLELWTTAPNHTYQYAGIKINTPGYYYTPLGGIRKNLAHSGLGASRGYTYIGQVSNRASTKGKVTPTKIGSFTVGGTLSGLSGGTVSLVNNSTNALSLTANQSFTFSTALANGSRYDVSVRSQPVGQTCGVKNGTGIIHGANVSNVSVSCLPNTTLTVASSAIIPVNGAPGPLQVTNMGTYTAYKVHALLPDNWKGVVQDSSDCAVIGPNGGTCTLTFTSNKPYVAQQNIVVSGDNIDLPPKTTLAFSMFDYLVWAVSGVSPNAQALVLATNNATTNLGVLWDSSAACTGMPQNCAPTTATSLYDGSYLNSSGNTYQIITELGTQAATNFNAASLCYTISSDNSGSGLVLGTWFLPSICQLGSYNPNVGGMDAGCLPNTPSIQSNLFDLGFVQEMVIFTPYWSSTDNLLSPNTAWYQGFNGLGDNSQFIGLKQFNLAVRCVRAFTY